MAEQIKLKTAGIGLQAILAQKEDNAKEIVQIFKSWGIHLEAKRVEADIDHRAVHPNSPHLGETMRGIERVLQRAKIVHKTEADLRMLRRIEDKGRASPSGPGEVPPSG